MVKVKVVTPRTTVKSQPCYLVVSKWFGVTDIAQTVPSGGLVSLAGMDISVCRLLDMVMGFALLVYKPHQ